MEGKAPVDFNPAMSVWWAHFNFTSAAVYGRGTAFRAAPPQGSVDVTPLVNWVADKVSDYKRNRRKPPIPLASPSRTPLPRLRPRRPRPPSPDGARRAFAARRLALARRIEERSGATVTSTRRRWWSTVNSMCSRVPSADTFVATVPSAISFLSVGDHVWLVALPTWRSPS